MEVAIPKSVQTPRLMLLRANTGLVEGALTIGCAIIAMYVHLIKLVGKELTAVEVHPSRFPCHNEVAHRGRARVRHSPFGGGQ